MAKAEQRVCAQCGAPATDAATVCRYCGAEMPQRQPEVTPRSAPQPISQTTPQYTAPPVSGPARYAEPVYYSDKSKVTAGVLTILLGSLGAHKFYLGKIGMGILYLLFCWTYIPAVLGVIEGIIYLSSTDEAFYRKYVAR